MFASAIITLVIGAILAQRFKVWVLVPVILFTLVIAIGTAIANVHALGTTAMTAAVVIVSLQFGYLLGIAGRYARLLVRANRLRANSLEASLRADRPAH